MQQKCRTCEKEFDGPELYAGYRLCRECDFEQLSRRWKDAPRGMFAGEKEQLLTLQQEEIERLRDCLNEAFAVVANAGDGDWGKESQYWQDNAKHFRVNYLKLYTAGGE